MNVSSWFQKVKLIHFIIILTCIGIAYWKIQQLSFLQGWDDQWFISNKFTEGGIGLKNSWAILTSYYFGQYAPVNQFFYTYIYAVFGYQPSAFHVVELMIHIINTFLVYYFVSSVSKPLFAYKDNVACKIAFVTSLLFSVSPFNMEPVVWISALKVTLYCMFYLLALIAYIGYIKRKRVFYFYIMLLCFTLSFGAKEQAITLVGALLLLDFVYKRDLTDKNVWLEKLPVLILAVLFALVTLESQGIDLKERENFYPYVYRIPLFFFTVMEYLIKTILPINVLYIYPYPFQVNEKISNFIWIYPLMVCLFIYCIFDFLKQKWVVFSLGFFLIHIIIVSNIISIARYSLIADRYAYVSSIGIYFLVACILYKISLLKQWNIPQNIFTFLYVTYFIIYVNWHSNVWSDAIVLKQHVRELIEKRQDFQKWDKAK